MRIDERLNKDQDRVAGKIGFRERSSKLSRIGLVTVSELECVPIE